SSVPLAQDLARLMLDQKADAIAAADPAETGRFTAARFLPGQLLVVSARHPDPALLTGQIGRKAYGDVYSELNDAKLQTTRFFIQDMGANGLESEGESIDIVYEHGALQAIFDGHPDRQKLSRQAYNKILQDADQKYTHSLKLLLDQARTGF